MIHRALAFDDVLITPDHSLLASRENADLSTELLGYTFKLPIASANMSTVTEYDMMNSMWDYGLGIMHRMCSVEYQCDIVRKFATNHHGEPVAASIGIDDLSIDRARQLIKAGATILCLDVAHADSKSMLGFLLEFFKEFGTMRLIIGNIATAEAATRIFINNRENWHNRIAFKVGVGSGSQCTTRIVTGCGLPTLASLLQFRIKEMLSQKQQPPYKLIADGGIKNSGDIVKALAAGADMVMVGSLLAGTTEAPGSVIKFGGGKYKVYRGSASFGQKYEITGKKAEYVEGEESLVPFKGSANDILVQLKQGIASGLSYAGARTIRELQEYAEFVEISGSGHQESKAHGA